MIQCFFHEPNSAWHKSMLCYLIAVGLYHITLYGGMLSFRLYNVSKKTMPADGNWCDVDRDSDILLKIKECIFLRQSRIHAI